MGKLPTVTREQITELVRQALYEFLITGRAGVGIPKKAFPAYWEIFLKSWEWRFDNLSGKKQPKEIKWTPLPEIPPFIPRGKK